MEAAIISCLELGFSAQVIQEKILSFKNAKIRLEIAVCKNKHVRLVGF